MHTFCYMIVFYGFIIVAFLDKIVRVIYVQSFYSPFIITS